MPSDVSNELPCPNCGRNLKLGPSQVKFACPACKEELVRATGENKLLLAHPLSSYLDGVTEDEQASARWEKASRDVVLINLRKRQETIEKSAQWVAQRRALEGKVMRIGAGLLLACGLLLGIAVIRIVMTGSVQVDVFISFIGASLFGPFGIFFCGWGLVERWSWLKHAAWINEERRKVQEEARILKPKIE
jgi:hypothetical protein